MKEKVLFVILMVMEDIIIGNIGYLFVLLNKLMCCLWLVLYVSVFCVGVLLLLLFSYVVDVLVVKMIDNKI